MIFYFRGVNIKITSIVTCILSYFFTPAYSCEEALLNFPDDCQFQDRYQEVKKAFQNEFNIDVLDINEYRALRFIGRSTWDSNLKKGQGDPRKMYKPAPVVWNLWSETEKWLRGIAPNTLGIKDIQEINRRSVNKDIMSVWAVKLKGARPGKIRSKKTQLPPQFFYTCDKESATYELVTFYKHFDVVDSRGRSLLRTSFHECPDLEGVYRGNVRYLKSSKVPRELMKWINSYNTIDLGDLAPIDRVADLQRRFISIHPFGDGNGRTSRFLQDQYLTKWKLPLPASGDLQKDLETPTMQYRQNMKKAIERSLNVLEACLEQYRNSRGSPQVVVSPECRAEKTW